MAELIDVANAMFRNKSDWEKITDEDKEKYFFIFNRYFSKMYPEKSQLLNLKNINKITSMDLWYHFMLKKPYPKWFWSKSEKPKSVISDKDIKLLVRKLNIKVLDVEYLIENHFEFVEEELKYYKEVEKGR